MSASPICPHCGKPLDAEQPPDCPRCEDERRRLASAPVVVVRHLPIWAANPLIDIGD